MRTVPAWNDAMSDGCSVPSTVRHALPRLLPGEPPVQCMVCVRHDRDYYYGGSAFQREVADERLRIGLITAGMARWRARMYWIAVRLFGRPGLHRLTTWMNDGVPCAWANAGGLFAYTDAPAQADA